MAGSTKSFFMGFLMGGLVGIVVALMMAPQSGEGDPFNPQRQRARV